MGSPFPRGGELESTSIEAGLLHTLFGILLYGGFIYFPPFIYLFDDLFMSAWTHGNLFYTLDCNPLLVYFFVEIVPTWATGGSDTPPILWLWDFERQGSTFLLSSFCSRLILYISWPPFLQGPLVPFIG